jgi:hypothetical protein
MGVLALGVSVPWARSGPPDFMPLLAIAGALVIVRFAIGIRLTPVRALATAAGGAAWAAAVGSVGFAVPTVIAIAVVACLLLAAGSARSSWP